MSGKILARVSALSLAILLAACGGDGDSTPLVDTSGGGGNPNDPNSPVNPENPGDTTPPPILSIQATPESVIAGNSRRIDISAVDADGNKVTGTGNQVTLSSVCAASDSATFDNTNLNISDGSVFTNYTPTAACVGSDIITARWNGDDEITKDLEMLVIQAESTPSLLLSADPASVIAGNSRRIDISAVDADGNKVTGTGNQVTLSSVCAASDSATFDNTNLNISDGAVFTNYTPSEDCVSPDIITARWNGGDDIMKSLSIEVLATQVPDLVLGRYMGGVFLEGEIHVLDSLPLSNTGPESSTTRLSVDVYDKANMRLAQGKEHKVDFYSSCSDSGWAGFNQASVTSETGEAKTVYTLGSDSLCTTSDTVYARLNDNYSVKAKLNIPIIDTNVPAQLLKVGILTGINFNEGNITANPGNLKITAGQPAPETELRFDIVDASNKLDTGTHTYEFTSMCLDAGRATITGTNGVAISGKGIATYTASAQCIGPDTVSVIVNENSDLRASTDLIIAEQQLVLGSLDGAGGFNPGVLNIASNQLGYNSNQNTTTDILTAVALEDGTGGYDVLRGTNVSLDLFSTCTESNRSTITTTGTTQTGELISLYTANDCVGDDVIYGRITGSQELASGSVTIAKKEGLDLQLGHFDSSSSNFVGDIIGNTRSTALLSGVQTKLFLSIVDKATGERVKGQPLTVEFASRCGGIPGAESPLSANTSTISLGYTEILYTAKSCDLPQDLVTATLTGTEGLLATAEVTIDLGKASANSLTADFPAPNSIAPSFLSTEGRETTSTLRVQLKNNQNKGVQGEIISFRLDNPNDAGSTDSAILTPVDGGRTDASGFAEVKIKAARNVDNVVFRVVSSFTDSDGNVIETFSAPIAVNSKLPVQERFSLGTSNFAPDAQGKNGVEVDLTLLAADDQGNRIRGNTIVNFETYLGTAANKKQAGSIDPECILDNDGRCTVTWEGLNIVSTNEAEKFATIRAYTQGIRADGSTGIIESSTRLLMSTSANIQVELTPNSITSAGGAFCAEAFVDILGNSGINAPPVGTTLEFEATGGTLIPASSSSFTLGSSSALLLPSKTFEGCTFFEPDPTSTDPLRLTVTATPPAGSPVSTTVVAP